MKRLKPALPVLVLLLGLMVCWSQYKRNAEVAGAQAGFDYDALASATVMDDGRAKPLDSVARNALLALYGKQRFVYEGEKVDALVWMMDLIARPNYAHQYKVFRIDHPDVIELLGLRPSDGYDNKFFSYSQILPARGDFMEAARAANAKEVKSVYDAALGQLADKYFLYESFARANRPLVIPPMPGVEDSPWRAYEDIARMVDPRSAQGEMLAFYGVIQIARERGLEPAEMSSFFASAVREGQLPQSMFQAGVLYSLYASAQRSSAVESEQRAYWDDAIEQITGSSTAPTADKAIYAQLYSVLDELESDTSVWQLMEMSEIELVDGADASWAEIVGAYRSQDVEAFNEALAEREAALSERGEPAVAKAGFEVLFNRAMPFVQAQALGVLGFLLAMGALYFGRSEKGTWGRSIWLGMMVAMVTAFVVHTLGIGARMYIHGRPPVTDLYSSAVLVGWACVGVCLLIEWMTKRGFGGIVAAVSGFSTLIIAHHLHLESGGDTMGPMRAVLDSNFWLATHVIVVTMGYSATFVAGLFAIVYIVMGMATPELDRTAARQLTSMVYGTVCFALLLSFVGTVLGGIWADQSWGRFWGWDPKENGAVMIVIMNAMILHAKWGRLVKERGMMVMAVSGNIITAWSWFGTNELGVGLHSYGFTEGTVFYLSLFVGSQLLVMAVALLVPTRYWWSFRKPAKKRIDKPGRGVAAAAGA